MVLTSSLTMPEFFRNRATEMLQTEERLTSRIGKLPDTYSFSKQGFRNDIIDTSQLIFGSAEYMKDGLVPHTEWLGGSPWSERMLGILDDLRDLTGVVKELPGSFYGGSAVAEVNGDLLQVLSRMYWFTVEAVKTYEITFLPSGKRKKYSGQELSEGIKIRIRPEEEVLLTVQEL